ncbi:MAG: response regulator [Calditrichia bacterium]|nr:response regulator [Calditrichia bacterium]
MPHRSLFVLLSIWLGQAAILSMAAREIVIPPETWKETGIPYIQYFSPREYGEHPQNWSIVQDSRGIMYFGNGQGVLVYNGVDWKLVRTPKRSTVRSLAISSPEQRIYVGAQSDLGYLASDPAGHLHFISLLDSIPEGYRDFHDVWETLARGDEIYFRTTKYIFRLVKGRFRVWQAQDRFHTSFLVNGTFYVRQWNVGLMRMEGDSLQLLPGGERFAQERIYVMQPYDETAILVGASTRGLFLYDGSVFSPFKTAADAFLEANRLYHGAALPGGLFVLATNAGGAAIIDKAGNLCQVINRECGLQNDNVRHVYADQQGGIWLALDNGLARVETPAPLSRFTAASGIESIVEGIIRHRGKLYAATHQGLYYLEKRTAQPGGRGGFFPRFKPVEGLATQVWALVSAGEHLLAGANEAVFEIQGDGERAIPIPTQWQGGAVRNLHRSQQDSNRVYVGLSTGLAVLQWVQGRWQDLGMIRGIDERVEFLAEDKEGVLWLGTRYAGVLKVEIAQPGAPASGKFLSAAVARFGQEHGLPERQINPRAAGGRIVFATHKGLRKFDAERQRFVPDTTFGAFLADSSCWIFQIQEDRRGNVWVLGGIGKEKNLVGQAVPHPARPGEYIWREVPFMRLQDFYGLFAIYPEPGGVAWFGGTDGIVRYTPDISQNYALDYSPVIGEVSIISSDSIVYGGAFPSQPFQPVLASRYNSLRFRFAAPSYDNVTANRYQFMLEGFDEDWSRWTREAQKDYTGLPGGDYVFKVRAKNIYGHLSDEARFEFTVLPPWYKSPWMYFLYALIGGALVFGLVKYRVRQLERKSHELEKIVAERTSQVVEQRNQLKAQSEKLQELDRLKSRFFANISHEFRTPLTLILGLLDKFMNKTEDRQDLADYGVMKRNAARLLQLINQLLDLAKLEAGGEKLQAARGDMVRFMRRIIMSFASLGEQKQVSMLFNGAPLSAAAGQTAIHAYFDRDKMEKVFYNLLSNAFKFTPPGGRIDVAVDIPPVPLSKGGTPGTPPFEGALGGMSPNAVYVEIRVANTGPGIPAEKVPYVFDRFYQADDGSTRKFEGSGIGLALVKELVELHRGEVFAESAEGRETTFTVRLPLGRAHLREEEIIAEETAETAAQPSLAGVDAEAVFTAEAPASDEREAAGAEIPAPEEDETAREDETLVLVVEDHPDLRDFIREGLAPEYRVIEAEDGTSGLKKAAELIPDLVISDIMMPGMDGYELCRRLKTSPKTNHIPVILLTARAAPEDKLAGLETGADDYLVKPFNPEELKIRVRNLIRLRQQMREKFSAEMLLKPSDITVPSTQKIFLERLRTVIEEHLDDEEFSVEALGEEMGMSRAQIHRKLRAITNQSASEFIRSFRLQRAAELIKQDAGNIAEIAYMVGFNSQAYFTRCFQEAFGCSPSEFKKRQGN